MNLLVLLKRSMQNEKDLISYFTQFISNFNETPFQATHKWFYKPLYMGIDIIN
jgi:hypothetical protein